MPITNYSSYRDKLVTPYQSLHITKANISTLAGRMFSLWTAAPDAGVVPSTASVPVSTTTGALKQINSSSVQRIAQLECSLGQSGYVQLIDRLSHQGGLSAIVTTSQTTNLPTAPLTRYTTGEGVFVALEIYTLIGATAVTVIVNYTNSLGTTGRTSEVAVFGGTAFREVNRFIVLPLQEGDVGVMSVQSVTVSATTGTAGNFGVTLFKPLIVLPFYSTGSQQNYYDSVLTMCGNIPAIQNDACLQWTIVANAANSGVWLSSLKIIEE